MDVPPTLNFIYEHRITMKTNHPNKSNFYVKTGEDLIYLPKGCTLLVGSDDDEAFARKLIVKKDDLDYYGDWFKPNP